MRSKPFLWLYELSEQEYKNKDLFHFMKTINNDNKSQIKLNILPISKQLSYLQHCYIFQPDRNTFTDDRFWIEQFHKLSVVYGGDRIYYTDEYRRSEHGTFLWNFEIKRNDEYKIYKSPAGKVVLSDDQKILSFLYYILCVEEPFNVELLVDLLEKLQQMRDLKLKEFRIKEFFDVLSYAQKNHPLPEDVKYLAWVLALGVLPRSFNIPRYIGIAIKEMKLDLLKPENEDKILNLQFDENLKKYFMRGLSVLVGLKHQLEEGEESINFLAKLNQYPDYQEQILKDLKLINFKFPRMTMNFLIANRFFADNSSEKINLLTFFLGSFSDPLEVMALIGHFMDMFNRRANEGLINSEDQEKSPEKIDEIPNEKAEINEKQEPFEEKIPGFEDEEEVLGQKPAEEKMVVESAPEGEKGLSREDEEALARYLKDRILYSKLPKHKIAEAITIYTALLQKVPESIQPAFFNWIINSNPDIEQILQLYSASQSLFENHPELVSTCSFTIKDVLFNSSYTLKDVCRTLPQLLNLSRDLYRDIFDHKFELSLKGRLKQRLATSSVKDYGDEFKTLMLSEVIFPIGCIDFVQELMRVSAANKYDKEFLILEVFIPHEKKVSQEDFTKELRSVIKFFVEDSVDIARQSKFIGQIIEKLNPKSSLPLVAVREFLTSYHAKNSVKEVLKLCNYPYLFDHGVFLTEYVAYVNDKIFSEFKAKDQKINYQKDQIIKYKKNADKKGKGETKNKDGGIKQYIEILKPTKTDAQNVYDLKTKLLNTLLNMVDSDQVNITLQSILYEEPRTDHIWYIMLEIADIPGFNYKEIRALETIVTSLDKVLQSLNEKSLDMQTVAKLYRVAEHPEKKRIFVWYLHQAQTVKRNPAIIDVRKALESIVAAHQACLKRYQTFDPYLKAVANYAHDGVNLVVAYNLLKDGLDKMKVKDFDFSEELKKHEVIFTTFAEYSESLCYKNYYSGIISQLNKKPEEISIEEYNIAIMEALDKCLELKDNLPKFAQWTLGEIQSVFKGIDDPTKEIETLKHLKLILDENVAKGLQELLEKFYEREKKRELCECLRELFKIFEVQKGELSSHIDDFLNMLAERDNVIAENFSALSNKMRVINDCLKNQVLCTMIEEIAGAEELIQFVKSTHEEDIKTMLDGLDEHGESLLRAQSIVELNIVKQYMSKIDKSSEVKLLESMMDLITKQSKIFNGIEKFIASCKNEIRAIKNLYGQLTSREEANKTKIMEIVKKSLISIRPLSDQSSDEYNITFHYKDNKILTLTEAADLRDRALLIVNKEKSVEALMENYSQEGVFMMKEEEKKEEEQNAEKPPASEDYFKVFIEMTDMTVSIQLNLIKLHETGYPESFEREIHFQDGRKKELQEFESSIKLKLDVWEENIKQCVRNSSILSNFYGQQYWILEKIFLPDCSEKDQLRGLNILRYLNPKISIKDVQDFVDNNKEVLELTPKERLEKLGSKLSKLFDKIGEAPKQEITIKYENRYSFGQGRILLTKCTDKFAIVERILSIYAKPIDGSQYPTSNQILFCSNHTTWENLRSFLFLIFSDTTGSIYTLANADKLPFSLKSQLTQAFKELYDEQEKPRFRLAIICTDPDSQLYAHFMQYSVTFSIKDNVNLSLDEIKELLSKWDVTAPAITSHRNGLGKTHLIKKLAKETGQQLVSFIITGNVNLASYAQRLCSNPVLSNENTKIALHLDIGTVDDYAAVNEFLFMIICLRAFKVQNDAFICNKNISIYVEIANTWSDKLKISLPFCHYLKQKFIDKLDLDNIDPGNSLDNPIQQACNYLHLLNEKRIDTTEIRFAENKGVTVLTPKQCAELLKKYFVEKQDAEHQLGLTYSQIMSFCKMLASQAKNLSEYYLSVEGLSFIFMDLQNQVVKDLSVKIRSSFLEVLVGAAEEFTVRSVFSSKSSQYQTIHELNEPEKEIEINAQIQAAIANSIVSWEQSNHLTLLFDDGGKFIPVYRDFKQVSDNLRTIILSQNISLVPDDDTLAKIIANKNDNMIGGKQILTDYSKSTHRDLLAILKDIANMHFKADEEAIANDDKLTDYVLTPDNFLKMALIMNRVKANIPVVIMGETGCGKTSLVKYLATKVLKQEFESFNLHAGITEATFLKRMFRYFERAEALALDKCNLWLFLDEFNTCDSIGLISEMICNGTLLGSPLPRNLRLIAACNPYKIKSVSIDVGLVQKKTSARLLHKVHPLPHSLMDFVWDYGFLNQKEEKKYILNMIGNLRLDDAIGKLLTEVISEVQEFIRRKEDSSSVSLRDVNRFKQVFSWFKKSLSERPEPLGRKKFSYWKKDISKLKDPKKITIRAIVLALTHCYIYRFSSKATRKELIDKCVEVMKENGLKLSDKKFKKYCNDEQEDYLYRMNLPKGIALNSALKENVFTALVCIVNKIPCFICGKPGCSKTLTVQLLSTNLRGVDSIEPFFRTLPEVYVITFQGSESSTSEGIEKAFEKARALLAKNADRLILPLVVFDEMGLAELSPNNPLKVLHSLLEPDKAEVAFVGISNWRLDASKMNRVVFLARPDPDLEDLELTAISIHQSYSEQSNDENEKLMRHLARVYFEYKKKVLKKTKEFADFHGTRDFYYLIKYVTQEILSLKSKSQREILEKIKIGFERNFSGRDGSARAIQVFFKNIYNRPEFNLDPISVLNLIEHNLKDKTARYLMVITRGAASYILEKHFNKLIQNKITLVGSKFPADINTDEYSFRVLSEVILYMEKGWTLVMEGLDNIYGSLFDLFNQNFSIIGKRKNCRIALGSVANPMCGVADDFRCIVLVDESEVPEMEPPFLNRFEKYVLNFENIMTPNQLELAEKLQSWVEKLTTPNDGKAPKIPLECLLCNYSNESAYSLIFNYDADGKEEDSEALLRQCKKDIIKTATSYLLFLAQSSVLQAEDPDEVQFFNETYLDQKNPTNLEEAIIGVISENGYPKKETQRLVVYTFDNILVNSKDYLQNMKIPYTEVNLGNIYSEKEISDTIRTYFSSNKELLIIRADGSEHLKHISKLNFLINKLSASVQELNAKIKHFCIIVHLPLNLIANDQGEGRECISYLAGWQQITLDSLAYHPIRLYEEIMNQSSQEIINKEKIITINNKTLIEVIEAALFKFKYTLIAAQDDEGIANYLDKLITQLHSLPEDDKLWKSLRVKVLEGLKFMAIPDWKVQLTTNKELLQKQYQPLDVLKYWIKQQLDRPLTQLLVQIEKNSAFESYFTSYEEKEASLLHQSIWLDVLEAYRFDMQMRLQRVNQSIEVTHLNGLTFAFSYREFKHILDNDMKVAEIKEQATEIQRLFEEIKENEKQMRYLDLASEEERLEFQIKEEANLAKLTAALELCKNKTSYKDHFDTIIQSQILRDSYIADVITIYTAERMKKSSKFARFLNLLVKRLVTVENTLYQVQVYYLLYKYESVFSKLTDIMQVYEKIGDLDDFAEQFNGDLPEEYNDAPGQQKWLLYALELLLKSIKPSKQLIDKIGGFEAFLAYLQTFIIVAFSIKTVMSLDPKSLETLQFWNDILVNVGFIQDEAKKIQLFSDLYDIVAQDEEFLKNEEILILLRDKIAAFCTENKMDNLELIRLKTLLYMRYLKHNIGYKVILDDIIAHPKLMAQCGVLINQYFSNFDVDETLDFLRQEDDEILAILEEALIQSGTNSPFASLLSETIGQLISWPDLTDEGDFVDFLSQYVELWTAFSTNIDEILQNPKFAQPEQIPFSNLYVVAGSSILKKILKIYSTAILEKYELPRKVHECFSRSLTKETGLFNTLRIFLAKCLNAKVGSLSKLKELLMKEDHLREWGLKIQFGSCENVLDINAFPFKFKDKYREIENIVTAMLNTLMNDQKRLEDFNKILEEASRFGTTKLCLLQVITNKIYLMQANKAFRQGQEFSRFAEWVNANQEIIKARMGNDNEAAKMIRLYCSNFPLMESLKIDENTDIKRLQMISVKVFIINTVIALKDCSWPFTDLFFENDRLTKFLSQTMAEHYLVGLPESSKIDYLMDLVPLNFKPYTEEEIGRGQWNANLGCALYKCSDACDYFYIVGGCTRVLENNQLKCWEGHLLGGTAYNKPHQRQGHRKILQGERDLLMATINKLRASESKGYAYKPVKSHNYGPRNLKPIGYHCLQYLLHEVINFFSLTKMIDDEAQIRTALNLENQVKVADYLQQQVSDGSKILSALLENTDNSNLYIVLNGIISNLVDLATDDKYDTKTLEGRNKFETNFQEKITTITQNLLANINQFKIDFGVESKDKANEIPMIQEIFEEGKFDQNKYPLQRLFRRTKEVNADKFRTDYLLNSEKLKKTNGFINMYIEKEDELQKLKVLQPT